jgi:hypothetical protein
MSLALGASRKNSPEGANKHVQDNFELVHVYLLDRTSAGTATQEESMLKRKNKR